MEVSCIIIRKVYIFFNNTIKIWNEAICNNNAWDWMSEGWYVWAESNNFGIHWGKNTNTQINEEDPNIDNNLVNTEREDFLIPGVLGYVPDRCHEGPGGRGVLTTIFVVMPRRMEG